MTERSGPSWLVYVLAALCVGAVVTAILVVGPASGSQATVTRTAKVARGVVQSSVSGAGNLQPASQLDLGFQTAGTVTHIYVEQGQQVAQGQLLATLDPEPAEVTLEQARADLLSARASLAKEEETDGEGSAAQGSNAQGSGAQGSAGSGSRSSSSSSAASKPTISAATREANLASARAAVSSAELTVQSDEQALAHTRLYAPQDGTVVSLAGQVGEVASASGTTKASSASSGSSGSGSTGSTGSGASATGRSGSGSSASGSSGSSGSGSSGSGSSGSPFAVLSDLESMQLVVPLAESEIASVHPGQIVTITVEALAGRKLAAHVHEVATLSTTNSGVVSYDVTFQLDQLDPGLKPGMSASAEVVVKQAEGLNVPTSAISGGSVTVIRGGQHVRQSVVTGLAGNTSTIVLSGVHEGETVLLPTVSTSSAGSSSLGSSRRGGGGLGGVGALGGFGGAGGGVVFRGPG
jgi:multidrug efflux pump subunit AcrA (membrane-fusion protein)